VTICYVSVNPPLTLFLSTEENRWVDDHEFLVREILKEAVLGYLKLLSRNICLDGRRKLTKIMSQKAGNTIGFRESGTFRIQLRLVLTVL